MQFLQPTYYSKLFRDFKSIDAAAYRDIIHFFERHEQDIRQLDFEEYFEMLYAYVNALFEAGMYRRHVVMADEVIEAAICHNIHLHGQEDVFRKALFRKAASLYHISDYTGAVHILRELLRIDPADADAMALLEKCLHHMENQPLLIFRAGSILLLLLSALVVCVEMLVVRPFYAMHTSWVETLRNAMFAGALVVLALGEGLHRWLVRRQVRTFVATHRQRKQKADVQTQTHA